MTDHMPDDLSAAGRDLRAFTDELRPQHRVVRNVQGEYVLLGHHLVVEAALDAERYSSAVSRYLQVPNGLDGADHAAFRAALDPLLSPDAVAPYEPVFRAIAAALAASAPRGVAVDAVGDIGARFAVRAQTAWLGWPTDLEDPLLAWMAENHEATRSGEGGWMRQVAEDFDAIIRSVLEPRRGSEGVAGDDVTAQLMRTTVAGRPLTDEELVSVLRNWTGGDLGSIALCVGVLLHHLAVDAGLQDRLRVGVPDEEWDAVIDEILRIDDPFVSNRRITTCPVEIGGVSLPERTRVKLNWTSANRDESVFGDPDAFDPVGNAPRNLVYGTGPHVCPGRALATVELRLALQELLAATASVTLAEDAEPEREVAPVGGWARVPVLLA